MVVLSAYTCFRSVSTLHRRAAWSQSKARTTWSGWPSRKVRFGEAANPGLVAPGTPLSGERPPPALRADSPRSPRPAASSRVFCPVADARGGWVACMVSASGLVFVVASASPYNTGFTLHRSFLASLVPDRFGLLWVRRTLRPLIGG